MESLLGVLGMKEEAVTALGGIKLERDEEGNFRCIEEHDDDDDDYIPAPCEVKCGGVIPGGGRSRVGNGRDCGGGSSSGTKESSKGKRKASPPLKRRAKTRKSDQAAKQAADDEEEDDDFRELEECLKEEEEQEETPRVSLYMPSYLREEPPGP